MSSNPNYVKKQITVDTVSWTAIVAPVDCMAVSIKNSALVDLKIRTDSGDATTQDTISAGSIETVAAPRHAGGIQDAGSGTRFYAGDTIGYLQAANRTSDSHTGGPGSRATPDDSSAAQAADEKDETTVSIPRPDLIPLYDRLQDCRAAQVETAALQKDLSDEQATAAALLKERNAAITAAHGGSVLRRLTRAAKWFAVGLATGAALAEATHHR